MPLTRRTVLVATGAATVATSLVGAALILSDRDGHAVGTLGRILGDLRIEEAELRLFLDAFYADWDRYEGLAGRAIAATSNLAADAVPIAPEAAQDLIERYERRLVTAFETWTDHAAGGQTTFLGRGACINPFAIRD